MAHTDRGPLLNTPATKQIMPRANNRLGAVYSALHRFWSARHAAVTAGQGTVGTRRDAYSIVLFNGEATNVLVNDFTSSPDQLLNVVLGHRASGWTNYAEALQAGQALMKRHWSSERFETCSMLPCLVGLLALTLTRTPVMIFLSDGECMISDEKVQDVCRSAIPLG